jgi:cytochrome P450
MRLEDINLCDLSYFEQGLPHDFFDFLRKNAPVWFHPANELTPDGEGFWVISKYEDVKTILKNHEVFSSETGHGARVGGGTILQDLATDMGPGQVLAMMDPPKHDDIRLLVNQGFFPKTLKLLEAEVRESVNQILDQAIDAHAQSQSVDFFNRIAAQLPLEVICKMGGVPKADWPQMMKWANDAIRYAAHDPRNDKEALIKELTDMGIYAFGLIERIRKTADDPLLNNSVMAQVIHAEIPGSDGKPRKLDELELIRFFNLLITGGTETTRNAITYGLYQLVNTPEQYNDVLNNTDELLPQTLEEMLRYSSPVHFNRRTASEDVEYKRQQIKRGDKVTLWYPSANRDEDIFSDPHRFNIYRHEKPHIAFGHGIHHCIGAALARMEMRILFEEFFARVKNKKISTAKPLRFIRSNRHQGVAEMVLRIG